MGEEDLNIPNDGSGGLPDPSSEQPQPSVAEGLAPPPEEGTTPQEQQDGPPAATGNLPDVVVDGQTKQGDPPPPMAEGEAAVPTPEPAAEQTDAAPEPPESAQAENPESTTPLVSPDGEYHGTQPAAEHVDMTPATNPDPVTEAVTPEPAGAPAPPEGAAETSMSSEQPQAEAPPATTPENATETIGPNPDEIPQANKAEGVPVTSTDDFTHHEGEEGRSMNVDKAWTHANAADEARDNSLAESHRDFPDDNPEYHAAWAETDANIAAKKAGEDYELEELAKKYGKTKEDLENYMSRNNSILLRLGHELIENQRKFGEKLTPAQEAFDVIAEFYNKHFNIFENSKISDVNPNLMSLLGEDLTRARLESITYIPSFSGDIEFEVSKFEGGRQSEAWHVNPFHGERSTYVKSETSVSNVEDWTNIETTKKREMTEADIEHLKQVLAEFEPRKRSTEAEPAV